MKNLIEIAERSSFDKAFGSKGLSVGPRTGPEKRTKDDKEWWVIRRFLKSALQAGLFATPCSVQKCAPPEPDFSIMHADTKSYIEITEATNTFDQREMTEFERSDKTVALLGQFGGRFADGAARPELAWAEDILKAISRKKGKSVFQLTDVDRHLVIYPNSNASALISSEQHESEAMLVLKKKIAGTIHILLKVTNGCSIHVLAKEYLCLNLLGEITLVRRQ